MAQQESFFYKSNRLQQIRGFYYTIQLGSVSQAAIKMGLQQSAVSMQIKSLERDLGTSLFDRNGPQMQPTIQAQELYKIVLPHIEGIDSLPDRFQATLKELHSRRLKIGANQASLTYLLPEMIGTCKKQFPDLELTIETLNKDPAMEQLRRDEIQAYVGAVQDVSDEFDFFPIAEYEAILIARHDHPLIVSKDFKVSDVANYAVVRCPPEFVTVPMFDELMKTYDVKLYVMLEHGDWEIFKSIVVHSDAFTMVSRLCYDPKRDQKVGVRGLGEFIPDLRYGIVVKKGKYITPPLQALLDSIVA